MEAVPKLSLLSFELKTSPENTHFGPKLKQYIAEAYREDPESYSNEIHQLECLRSAAVRPSIDSAGLGALVRYFCQLRAIQSRFPMAKGQPVAVSFAWKDVYACMTCPLSDIRFELACILHNIAALNTQLAGSEPRTTAESLKAACTKLLNAAWAFEHLREQYPQPPGVDLSSDIMRLLQEICLAQAQECILEKSIQDTKKPSIVGAVATQVMLFYKNSIALLGPSTGTDNIHEVIGTRLYNYWYRYLSFKMSYMGCIVCLYQGMNAEEQQKMGERVAFYQQAAEKLAEARKLAKYVEPTQDTNEALTFTNDVVEGKKKAAKNENEFIYHEKVPDKDLLVDLKAACLVKPMPLNLNDPEVSGPDIFARLVPMGAHEESSMYSEEKAKLLRRVVGQAEVKNTELMEFMSSLQLDQLDLLDSDQKIPQEIVDRCAEMNAKTEIIQTLMDSMNSLAEIISDVEHSLAEIKTMIQEETLKEKEFQKVMGPRPPSIVQTELSREYHKYQEAHTRTNESNQVLHKAMTLHIANLRLLSQPLDVLQSKIPSIENIEGLDRETMLEMRRVVGKAREMQAQRDSLVQQLREEVTADDITSKLLARNNESPDEIFKQELEKHTPKVKIIEQNLAAQENIINRLTSLYASYGDSRRLLSDVLRKREGLINALTTSFDTYEELLGKSQKGQEFYKKLSHNVNQLLTRLRSTCQVQQEERAQQLATQTTKAPSPAPTSTITKTLDSAPLPPTGSGRKLKDYLPYMKNRTAPRSVTPQAQVEPIPTDTYYPESIYPTSVRPTPVGSEATDLSQMKIPDGVVMPPGMQNPNMYNRYGAAYVSSESDPYALANYNYAMTAKTGYEKPDEYGYSTSYTPPQYSTQVGDPQTYSNPYYSATHNNTTIVTDSQNSNPYNTNVQSNVNPSTSQYNPYSDPYATQAAAVSESTHMPSYNQNDMNVNFAQMQIGYPKSEQVQQPVANYSQDYSQTYYSVAYPQSATPNNATYSHAPQPANFSMTPSQIPSDYNSLNYPYSSDQQYAQQVQAMQTPTSAQPSQIPAPVQPPQTPAPVQPPQTPVPVQPPQTPILQAGQTHTPVQLPQAHIPIQPAQPTPVQPSNPASSAYGADYSYATSAYANMSQGYPIYTNTESIVTSTTSMLNNPVVSQPSYLPQESTYDSSTLSQLDALDKPIKSHVTGEALTTNINYQANYQNFDQNAVPAYSNVDQNYQPNSAYPYPNQSNMNYVQTYQNHPGYNYNSATGAYEYSYGSQNSYTNYQIDQTNVDPQAATKDPNWVAQGVYTSAGTCETVQSPSETMQSMQQAPTEQTNSNQAYYHTPYGYQTAMQPNETVTVSQPVSTNYGANFNQSTYMQSGHERDTSVTYTSNQVSSPKEELPQPSFDQSSVVENNQTDPVPMENLQQEFEQPVETKLEEKPEPSIFDLLSDIDFSVEQKPLMPEIKVPQISETVIKKPVAVPKPVTAVKSVVKEEVIERPAKMDLYSDPMLLNHFTQEVKKLRKMVESLDSKTNSESLDAKWQIYQSEQESNNTFKAKSIALQHGEGSKPNDIVPFDDSRLTLKSDPNAYLNASYYKQLAAWCIPLVISKTPTEAENGTFWKAVLENKFSCVVCLLSEIEMQGYSYWPTALGQVLELSGDVKVTLDDVKCTVHWTERKLTVTYGKTMSHVSHYQINVFPAKIVCPPLVLLADKILQQTYDSRLSNQLTGAWLQCGVGGGRCCVLALLLMVICQLRAGQLQLCDMLDSGCINLYKHRSNVIEEKKYLVDAYKTALFYVQGVFCSGTTMFNGEAVSMPSGAAVLPPVTPNPNQSGPSTSSHKTKFSRESFEEMKQSPGLKSGDMKDPLNFLDPLWSLKKK